MDTTKEIILTPEEYENHVKELKYLEGEKDAAIRAALAEARSFGDLSENAEYDAAKEDQARNAARIAELRHILGNAKVIDSSAQDGAESLTVSIGTTVELKGSRGKTTSFTIVGTTQTNSLEHKISIESPAGAALIGHAIGDVVQFTTPSGKVKKYTVVDITR